MGPHQFVRCSLALCARIERQLADKASDELYYDITTTTGCSQVS
jgi:hypothetical protein